MALRFPRIDAVTQHHGSDTDRIDTRRRLKLCVTAYFWLLLLSSLSLVLLAGFTSTSVATIE